MEGGKINKYTIQQVLIQSPVNTSVTASADNDIQMKCSAINNNLQLVNTSNLHYANEMILLVPYIITGTRFFSYY